jgi:hypothetical protein
VVSRAIGCGTTVASNMLARAARAILAKSIGPEQSCWMVCSRILRRYLQQHGAAVGLFDVDRGATEQALADGSNLFDVGVTA